MNYSRASNGKTIGDNLGPPLARDELERHVLARSKQTRERLAKAMAAINDWELANVRHETKLLAWIEDFDEACEGTDRAAELVLNAAEKCRAEIDALVARIPEPPQQQQQQQPPPPFEQVEYEASGPAAAE